MQSVSFLSPTPRLNKEQLDTRQQPSFNSQKRFHVKMLWLATSRNVYFPASRKIKISAARFMIYHNNPIEWAAGKKGLMLIAETAWRSKLVNGPWSCILRWTISSHVMPFRNIRKGNYFNLVLKYGQCGAPRCYIGKPYDGPGPSKSPIQYIRHVPSTFYHEHATYWRQRWDLRVNCAKKDFRESLT